MNKAAIHKFSIGLMIICVLVMFSISCDLATTKIGDISKHPRDYAGKEVTLSGEVMETFSMIFVKYFVLRDATGEILVVTERTLPAKGERIKVKGKVQEAFSIGTKTALVVVETPEKIDPASSSTAVK